jgi:hypothetical protein
MQEQAFDETAAKHPEAFGNESWTDLIRDDKFAINATAYYVRDLQDELDANLPRVSSGAKGHDRHQLVAYDYNSGEEATKSTASWAATLTRQVQGTSRRLTRIGRSVTPPSAAER